LILRKISMSSGSGVSGGGEGLEGRGGLCDDSRQRRMKEGGTRRIMRR
jgi:hypothetical protein